MQGDERNQVDTFRIVLYIILIILLLSPGNNNSSSNLRDSEEVRKMKEIRRKLGEKLDLDYSLLGDHHVNYAYNISGIYMGNWKREDNTVPMKSRNITLGVTHELLRLPSNSTIQGKEGLMSLQLYHRSFFRRNIDIIDGTLTLIEGEQDSEDDSFSISLIGFYFLSTGNLVLYGNTYGSRFHVDWQSTPATKEFAIDNSFSRAIGYSVNATNRFYLSSQSQFPGEATKRCFYSLNMQIQDLPADMDPEISHHEHSQYIVNGTGLLESFNCNDTISLTMGGYNIDTVHITAKARWYTVIAICVSFTECILYIKLFHQFATSSAYPASQGMIFLFAALDLLSAMAHSLAGVLFMGILSELYFVSFHKFFVFSVIEIRLLYLIWHSRHPDINNNNIASLQRELSLMYVSLYVIAIVTVILFYMKAKLFPLAIFILYSFWVPQIARSLRLGQRPPYSPQQIVLITVLKLFLPLYLFVCPYNLIEMFTEISVDYRLGRLLILWVLIQVIA